ncbi:hypothetical protein ACC736_38560, partial [Rhizobium ruizarguesonis]
SGSEVALQQGEEGQLSLQISDAGITSDVASARSRSLDIVGRRIAGFVYENFLVRPDGADRRSGMSTSRRQRLQEIDRRLYLGRI